jgi:hypothetical protein
MARNLLSLWKQTMRQRNAGARIQEPGSRRVYGSRPRKPEPQMDADERRLGKRLGTDPAISSVYHFSAAQGAADLARQCFASASSNS